MDQALGEKSGFENSRCDCYGQMIKTVEEIIKEKLPYSSASE